MNTKVILFSAAAMMSSPSTANATNLSVSYILANSIVSAFNFLVNEHLISNSFDKFDYATKIQSTTISSSNESKIYFFSQCYCDSILGFLGPQIFSGSISTPTIIIEEYALFGAFGNTGALTIALSRAVLEFSTWIMLLVGFDMIGATARYRRRSTKATYA